MSVQAPSEACSRADEGRALTAQDAALGAHLANPVVGTYLEKHAELGEDFKVVRVLPWL